MNQRKRVVVTGIGMITPLGMNVKTTWDNLVQSKSGIKLIESFDTTDFDVKIGGCIERGTQDPNTMLDLESYISSQEAKRMDLFIQYGLIAVQEALKDANLDLSDENLLLNTAVVTGSGIGGLKTIEENSIKLFQSKAKRTSPFFIPASLVNLLSGHISIKYGFLGPNMASCTACATGAHTLIEAANLIRYGDADVAIAGSAEAPITELGVAGFSSMKALASNFNDRAKEASRPWDQDRSGFVIGEGAGMLVLEEYEHAKKRGAKIYGEILGYGMSGDAYHITSPEPSGRGARLAMQKALLSANLAADEINYINAHGTSTEMGDLIELKAVQTVFSNNSKLKMSSTKSALGHLLGAAGSVEAIISLLSLVDGVVPPTLNLNNPIPENQIDLVPHVAQQMKMKYALSNSFGFGGTNTSIIFSKI